MTFPSNPVIRAPRGLTAAVLTLAALATLTACRAEVRAADSTAGGTAATSAQAPASAPQTAAAAGTFTLTDFAHLRWLDGSWRGQLPDGKYFHERYRIIDDSTIAMQGFSDSTYTTVSDSSRIALRGTTVASEGATSKWEATRLDSGSVDFVSTRNRSSGFTWKRESADRWTATLWGAAGRNTVYNMERVNR